MASIKHWGDLEDEIELRLKKLMQRFPIFYLRLYDSHTAGTYMPPQPSDFILWPPKGKEKPPSTFLEAKYSGTAESLRSVFSNNVSDGQMASARLVARAGREYKILFYSATARQFELWDGFYCAERRSIGKPLELGQRIVGLSLDAMLEEHLLCLDPEARRRIQAALKARKI